MKYLIVNADDFGMTKGINEGIVKAMREGIVTSTSMVACGEAFDDAVKTARAHGIREVGAHLSLTEFSPITLPGKTENYKLFAARLLLGTISEDKVRKEFQAQIEKIKKAGFALTHLDSHEHIHMVPKMFRIFIDMARDYGIPAIRFLREKSMVGGFGLNKVYRFLIGSYLARKNERDVRNSRLYFPDNVRGFLDSGRLSESLLIRMLGSLSEGVTELICHPGFLGPEILDTYRWHINCEDELFALTGRAVKRVIESRGITLVGYKQAMELR